MKYIYLDHNATTPLHPEVLEAMLPFLREGFANPSSVTHTPGRQARAALEEARADVAQFIGASDPSEVIFTSGATESDNTALKGVAWAYRDSGEHIVTTAVEHKAVLDTCRWLERNGFRLTIVPVDRHGRVDPGDVQRALTERTILVSVMHANSEVGTIQPIEEIAAICRSRGVLLHCDATQTIGKVPVAVAKICDLAAFSGHKFYGPKGIGGLYLRRRVRIEPLITGGGHEKGRRSGTQNVAGAIGLAAACRIASRDLDAERHRLLALRQRLHDGIVEQIEGAHLNGHPVFRLPNNLNFSFESVEGEALILAMKNVALSSGSACTSGSPGPSYVLKAMGVPDELAHASLRFGLGRSNDAPEIDAVLASLSASVTRLRELSAPI